MPKISVLLPVYNTSPRHLREAIDSVLGQTFGDFELLICNDSPTALDAEDVVLGYKDARIRYLKNEKNLGIARTRNLLIEEAKGEYLAVMDHDDLCLPTRFEKQVALMDAQPDVVVCGTAHRRFGKMFKNDTIRYPQEDADIRVGLFFKCVIHHPSAMMRRCVLVKHKVRYDERLISANDRKLYMDASAFGKLHNLQEVLCLYRLHSGMTSRTKRQAIAAEQKVLRQEFLDRMGAKLTPRQLEVLNDYVTSGRCRIKSRVVLDEVEAVLTTLVEANGRSGYLPQAQFAKICAKYLIKRCYNATLYGRVVSKDLLKRTVLPVSSVRQPVLLRLVNFFAGDEK